MEPKYGPTENGEYVTPYAVTIFHHDNPLEIAIGAIAYRSQCVPIPDDSDCAADICEYISPEVVIFGTEFPRSAIDKLFARGFQTVRICTDQQCEKYYENGVPYHPRLFIFGTDELYENINLHEGYGALGIYVLEHVLCAQCADYKSPNATAAAGQYLLAALRDVSADLAAEIRRICATMRGFDIVEQYIVKGRTILEMRGRIARTRLQSGLKGEFAGMRAVYVYAGDLYAEIIDQIGAIDHPLIVLYAPAGERLHLTLISREVDARELLTRICPDADGHAGCASAFVDHWHIGPA